MKKPPRFILVLSLTTTAIAFAQTTPPADDPRGPRPGAGDSGGPGRGPGSPVVRVLDVDKNGEVSASELAGAAAAIRTLDTNGDGVVSAEEIRPARPANAPTPPANAPTGPTRPAGHVTRPRPLRPVILALDANNARALSASEIANAPASLAALDANKDGKLTHDELRPLPPQE